MCLYNGMLKTLNGLYTHTHAYKLVGESWHLITAIHDEGYALTLCK
jgi:hypothetical protein